MEIKDFNTLLDHKLITNVDLADYYLNNTEALDELADTDLMSMGILSQPTVNDIIKTTGVASLRPILNQDDLMERIEMGHPIKLTNDLVLDTCIIINGQDASIDLNGYSITAGIFTESNGDITEGDTDSYVFWVKDGSLAIFGNGDVIAQPAKYSIAVWCQGGAVLLDGGNYYNGEDSDLIYASGSGNVKILNGYFKAGENNGPGTKNKYSVLNIKDKDRATASIEVMGGKYYMFDPANNLSEGENTNFVHPDYTSITADDINYSVILSI